LAIEPVERRVVLTGVDLPLRAVWFMGDAHHAWAWFESCPAGVACRYALGSTVDGGVTWRSVALPDLGPDPAPINVYPLDTQTLTLHVVGKRFWLTTDGGVSFTRYPATKPPVAALRANTWPVRGGEYTLLCPRAVGFEDGASGIACDRQQLVRIGVGPVQPQPALPGRLDEVVAAGDGRLWLASQDGGLTRVAMSPDGARTWQELIPVAAQASLAVSPDGHDVWLTAYPNLVWRLSGPTFAPEPIPDSLMIEGNVLATGAGMLVLGSGDGASGFWHDGAFTTIAGRSAVPREVLPDGSIVFGQDNGACLVAVGAGLHRSWVRLS
jgi:hypothetical protein